MLAHESDSRSEEKKDVVDGRAGLAATRVTLTAFLETVAENSAATDILMTQPHDHPLAAMRPR
jgi:hypothetical protein